MPNLVSEMPLSKVWTDLGTTRDFEPVPLWRSRFLWFGECASGKTSLVCSFPDAIVLDLEGKTKNIPNKRAYCVQVPDHTALVRVLNLLQAEAAKPPDQRPFKHVVFDSLDRLQEYQRGFIEKKEGKDLEDIRGGRGAWDDLFKGVLAFPRLVWSLGYGWSIVAHLQREIKNIGGADVEKIKLQCTPKIAAGIKQDSEHRLKVVKTIRQEPIEWITANGKKIPTKFKPVSIVTVEVDSTVGPSDGLTGCQVQFPASFEIPPVDGMATVKRLYNEAIAATKIVPPPAAELIQAV